MTSATAKKTLEIPQPSSDPTVNLCLDTIAKSKQAIVFCNTKRGAESQAEHIAEKLTGRDERFELLASEALNALSSPTKQCKRLALCLRKGIAFHHAGLHAKQRDLVESKFRDGTIKVICSTPTLAMGLDLPAFRVVIRDLKRFGEGAFGMSDIPVLEYHQMAGRAGRPGKETYGEAIILAETEDQKEQRTEKYILGEPEEIYSKLAVEPVLRTYVLSLIASEFVSTRTSLHEFFERTFYAKQYGDTRKLRAILDKMTDLLEEWEFLIVDEGSSPKQLFRSAKEIGEGRLHATLLGKRVAELYLDPYTAHFLMTCLRRAASRGMRDFAGLHMLASCLEMRPWLRPKVREVDAIVARLAPELDTLLSPEPVQYSDEYEEFLMTAKTAIFLQDWIEETQEDELLEKYGIAPGEVHAKLDRADWLIYASEELVRLMELQQLRAPLARLRLRLKHGAKEELLALLQLKGVGRVRARKLFGARYRTVGDVKSADISTLAGLLGKAVAIDLKRQVGEEHDPEKVQVPSGKRKGQRSMGDYSDAI